MLGASGVLRETVSKKYFPLMMLAHVILSGAFVWIYARGAEAKPWLTAFCW
jgi:hypothetical protein